MHWTENWKVQIYISWEESPFARKPKIHYVCIENLYHQLDFIIMDYTYKIRKSN